MPLPLDAALIRRTWDEYRGEWDDCERGGMAVGYQCDWTKTDSAETNPNFKCQKCGSHNLSYRSWESSDEAFEDFHYRCDDCKWSWWVDGADA